MKNKTKLGSANFAQVTRELLLADTRCPRPVQGVSSLIHKLRTVIVFQYTKSKFTSYTLTIISTVNSISHSTLPPFLNKSICPLLLLFGSTFYNGKLLKTWYPNYCTFYFSVLFLVSVSKQ